MLCNKPKYGYVFDQVVSAIITIATCNADPTTQLVVNDYCECAAGKQFEAGVCITEDLAKPCKSRNLAENCVFCKDDKIMEIIPNTPSAACNNNDSQVVITNCQ